MVSRSKRRRNRSIVFSLLAIVVVLGVLYFSTQQSFINVAGVPSFETTESWSAIGSNVSIKAPFIGNYVDAPRQDICGGNDGDFRVSNSYSIDGSLSLSTSFANIDKRGCNENNEINAEFTIPAGELTINYDLSTSESYSDSSTATLSINDFSKISRWNVDCNLPNRNPGWFAGNCISPTKGTEKIVFNESTKINIKLTSSQGYLGSANAKVTLSFEKLQEAEQPTESEIPQPKGFSAFLNAIKDFLSNLFSGIFVKQQILGSIEVEPNTQETYVVDVSVPKLDNDWSDGSYQVNYANWGLFDKNGNLIDEGTWERINTSYKREIILTTPSSIGDYSIVALITQYNLNYNSETRTWESGEEIIINKEAVNLKTKRTVEEPTIPGASGFNNFINKIIDWFKNLFN